MSAASPAANSANAGTAETWFKIWEDPPVYENGALVFPSTSAYPIYFLLVVRGRRLSVRCLCSDGPDHFHHPQEPPKRAVPPTRGASALGLTPLEAR